MDAVDRNLVFLGGSGSLLAGLTTLFALVYVFGLFGLLGMTDAMLLNPALLLPWIAAHPVLYSSQFWILLLSLFFLLPVPLALNERLKTVDAALSKAGAAAGMAGILISVIGLMLTAASAPVLARAYILPARYEPATVLLLSEVFERLGLLLRLCASLFLGAWLAASGIVMLRRLGFSSFLGWFFVALADLILFTVVARCVGLFDLEALLSLLLAIAYGWLGIWLLRPSASQASEVFVRAGRQI